MMHPHLPGPLPVAVPDIGFPQNISIGPKAFDSWGFADLSVTTVILQRGRSTGSFGFHRHGHGSRSNREIARAGRSPDWLKFKNSAAPCSEAGGGGGLRGARNVALGKNLPVFPR
jgi:hypothetical protein